MIRTSLGIGILALALAAWGCQQPQKKAPPGGRPAAPVAERPRPVLPTPIRAVWVARFHYKTPEDIARIMAISRELGFNTVIWQVRGEGTVSYRSQLEPWSSVYNYQDPGFDPLAIAVAEAHKNGLRIEAWMNTLPGWKGPKEPPIPNQLWNQHPEWFLQDANGKRQPLGDFYVILNPCWPEVRQHIVNIAAEIARNYAVDGIHLDYVRYAWDTTPNARQLYPRDPRTLELYFRETGKRPDDDPAAWDAWRANQITRIVHDMRQMLDRVRPTTALTGAVWRNPQLGYGSYLQNAAAWLRAGLMDVIYPMTYTPKVDQFESDIAMYQQAAPGRRVVPGLGVYMIKDPETLRAELQRCRMWGGDFVVFSYESLAPTGNEVVRPNAEKQAARQWRNNVIREFLAPPPPTPQ